MTRAAAHRIALRTTLFASIPLLSSAAVFYNTHPALYLCFLVLVAHFLPGRIDMPPRPDQGDDR